MVRGKGAKGETERKQQATLHKGKVREGESVVRDLLFSHVRCRERDDQGERELQTKALYLALVVWRPGATRRGSTASATTATSDSR